MAEYWKSTPKYWCKFCKVYVRDTKLEKQQHESTGRHQGSIQKSLRDIHRGKDREERDKQRAKNEIARLNGLVASKTEAAGPSESGLVAKPAATFTKEAPKKATAEDRKRQMAQLAAMGIAIPDEYRKELALSSEWQAVSTQPAAQKIETGETAKPDAIVKGVRKRMHNKNEDEDEQIPKTRKGWGSQRMYPGTSTDLDFDVLLKEPIKLKHEEAKSQKTEDENVKQEEAVDDTIAAVSSPKPDILIKPDEETPGAGIVFKKRKKPIRRA